MTALNDARLGIVEGKPLKDWVNAPYGAFAKAVRQNIDPNFGKEITEGKKEYEVTIYYSVSASGRKTFCVEANSEKEAETLAKQEIEDNEPWLDSDDFDVGDLSVESIKKK